MTLTDAAWVELPDDAVTDPAVSVRMPTIEELLQRWPAVEAMLAKATVRTGCYEPIDLLRMSMAGQAGFWLCETSGQLDAVIVTQITQYPRKRVLDMMFCGGGNLAAWRRQAIATLDEHARAFGCDVIATVGRPGWARAWDGGFTGDVMMVREVVK